MRTDRQLPSFATADWYSDPREHRCPHDAWLETIAISEPASGERNECRATAITLKLLGAYHDGHIIFCYLGVKKYSLVSNSSEHGMGDWLHDEVSVGSAGTLIHRIMWAGFGPAAESHWSIEADDISYEWIPKIG